MNAGELLKAIKANPASFVGGLGSSIRKFLTEEIGSTEKWWVSYREPSKYGLDRWKESDRFDPDDLDTWTKQEQENAKKFLNLNKLLTAATEVEDFLCFIDLNGTLVDPPRQLSTFEKLSLSPRSGRCIGFLAEFAAAFDFLCQQFIPRKSCANFPSFQDKFDVCISGSKWLEAIGNIPESLRINLPVASKVNSTTHTDKQLPIDGLSQINLEVVIGALGEYDIQFLIAMRTRGATSPESKKTIPQIVYQIAPNADPNSGYKKCTPKLQKTNPPLIVKCKKGGFYLSSAGAIVAERLETARKNLAKANHGKDDSDKRKPLTN